MVSTRIFSYFDDYRGTLVYPGGEKVQGLE